MTLRATSRPWDISPAKIQTKYETRITSQQITIAEACGWSDFSQGSHGIIGCRPNENCWDNGRHPVPNYLSDLNAMHEAEKVLTVAQRITYAHQLGVVMSVGRAIPNWWFIHEATAAQRAEAFLRTLNL